MVASRPPAPPRLVISVAMSTVGKRAAASASARASARRLRCSGSEACGRSSRTSSFGRAGAWGGAPVREGERQVSGRGETQFEAKDSTHGHAGELQSYHGGCDRLEPTATADAEHCDEALGPAASLVEGIVCGSQRPGHFCLPLYGQIASSNTLDATREDVRAWQPA